MRAEWIRGVIIITMLHEESDALIEDLIALECTTGAKASGAVPKLNTALLTVTRTGRTSARVPLCAK